MWFHVNRTSLGGGEPVAGMLLMHKARRKHQALGFDPMAKASRFLISIGQRAVELLIDTADTVHPNPETRYHVSGLPSDPPLRVYF